jgi:hypothetical protein
MAGEQMKRYHVVLTTINNPLCLFDYYKNIEQFGHLDKVKFWVVADKKTPKDCRETCLTINDKGLETIFVDLEMQVTWLKNFPEFAVTLPYNNDTRRNIGYLMAYEDGCETLITIDDDNFPHLDDFIGSHSSAGSEVNSVISDTGGFYNVCEHLEFTPSRHIYPRGFPFERRDSENVTEKISVNKDRVGINAGLWLESPDVDATTWLNGSVKGVSFLGPEKFVLHNSTWSPVNTQNTSIIRDLIPYYFCVPMGHKVPGGIIHRYGDIWGGYFALSVMQYTNFHTSFGTPIVNHNRNPHNYLVDLRQEFWGMLLTDWLLSIIKDFSPKETRLSQRGTALVECLTEASETQLPDWCAPEMREFVKLSTSAFSTYIKTANRLG